jgi:HSP20 family protein
MARELATWKPARTWMPFFDFERMRRDLDRLYESFFERTRRTEEAGEYLPALDICETKDQILVKAEVPGMEPKDLDVTLSDGILTLKGEKQHEREEKEGSCHLVERSYGAFSRSIQLPAAVQSDKINASYKNGVLQIILPKSEEAKTKEIKIKVE